MKKLALILALIMALSCFAGCGKNDQPESGIMVVDGWECGDISAVTLPEDVQAAFDNAAAASDVTPEPLAYLGSQVVAGINYAVMCRVTEDNEDKLCVVIIYCDLENNAEITGMTEFDLDTIQMAESDTADADSMVMAGGWTVSCEDAVSLPENVQSAFDSAVADGLNMQLIPLGYVGHQTVLGENYAVICRTDDDSPCLELVTLSTDTSGNTTVLEIADFYIADYTA